jgi:hypothetical protein
MYPMLLCAIPDAQIQGQMITCHRLRGKLDPEWCLR